MTFLEISVPFSLGVVSSLHCAQMCGPVVLAYSLRLERPALSHLAYNAGRITTYTLLGSIAGLVGGGVGTLGHLAGIERWTALVAGGAMAIAGLLLLPRRGRSLIQIGAPSFFSTAAGRMLRSASPASKMLLGSLMGFLPCGLVYAALIQSMSTASALSGAMSMLAFGTGTSGALLGLGFFSGAVSARLGRHSALLTSVSVIVAGTFLMWRGLHAPVLPVRCH